MRTVRRSMVLVALLCAGACTDATSARLPPAHGAETADVDIADVDTALVAMPGVQPPAEGATTSAPSMVAMIDADRRLAIVDEGRVSYDWFKWRARPAPDGTAAVLTLDPEITAAIGETLVTWLSLPDGAVEGSLTIPRSGLDVTATSLDAEFVGFSSVAAELTDGTIEGARSTSDITIASRTDGVVFEQRLDGNFVPEAFSRRLGADGVPAQAFLLEYFPAEAPRFYRVRVLSTETGMVSLPLNLRDKTQQIDERMAGFTRSQVVAHEQGLLFTLYRGTIDGTPDGEPYAFVHTLDFADGVWCLEVDPRLELDVVSGSLAVGGDRLYVASANGSVGSFRIPSITDPNLSPSMDWVTEVTGAGDTAPIAIADADGLSVTFPERDHRVERIDAEGAVRAPQPMPGAGVTALTWDDGGVLQAVGPDWTTFGDIARPASLDEITYLAIAG